MKTRVTFRVAPEIADRLRQLPNQTQFVETALRKALGVGCPTCGGTGLVHAGSIRLPNFKKAALPRLDAPTALQLQSLVRLARRLAATDVSLTKEEATDGLRFSVRRGSHTLMQGSVTRGATHFSVH